MDQCIPVLSQSTDKHRSQLVCSRVSHKEVCWGLYWFLMYIYDFAEGVTSQMRMFADDSIVYRQIHTPADYFTLASDLNKLLLWAKTWQMDYNVSKCAVLPVTTTRNISAYNYFIGANTYHKLTTRTTCGLPSTQNYLGDHICCYQISTCIVELYVMSLFSHIKCIYKTPAVTHTTLLFH